DRNVALKLLRSDRIAPDANAASQTRRSRLMREARIMARLAHPNIVTVYDAGTFAENFFVVMELVKGTTLRAWLLQEERSWAEVVRLFIDAGRGLAAAHAVGVVHRDFKPENVLVDQSEHARVTDFGLARPTPTIPQPEGGALNRPRASATSANFGSVSEGKSTSIAGTPGYMSPEQYRGLPTDARSDQFSFSVALFEALYGQRPFPSSGDRMIPAGARYRTAP